MIYQAFVVQSGCNDLQLSQVNGAVHNIVRLLSARTKKESNLLCLSYSCDGRVVKALDSKSNGIFPRRFEPYSQRDFFLILLSLL